MSFPSPPPHRAGLGPPPSLDGLTALLSESSKGGSTDAYARNGAMGPPAPKQVSPLTTSGLSNQAKNRDSTSSFATNGSSASSPSTSSTILSPNHPHNLRKQAKTQLDPSFSVKSYIGAANALLEKARSSDAQGQAEQAFVNYLKAADVAANIPKHADWPKTVEQRGPTYFRYQDFMKNVPSIIQRGHRLEQLLQAREESRAEEARNALRDQQQSMSRAENDLDGSKGGTDAVTDQSSEQMDALASRLSALRGMGAGSGANSEAQKRAPYAGGAPLTFTQSGDTLRELQSRPTSSSSTLQASRPESPNVQSISAAHGLASPRLERSGFAGITDDGPSVGPDMQPTHIPSADEFDKSYPTLDAFESTQKQPDMPFRPLPVPPPATASSSAAAKPAQTVKVTVEEFFPMLHPGFDTVHDAQLGTRMVRRKAPRTLLIDVRPRADYETAKIKGVDSVCIDPSALRHSVSVDALGSSIQQLGSRAEQQAFASRSTYDVLIMCDRDGRGLQNGTLEELAQTLTEHNSRSSTSAQTVMLLVGGFDRWARKVGDAGIQGDYAALPPVMPDAARNGAERPTGASNGDLQSKRQAMYISSPPPSLIPGHAAGNTSNNGNRMGSMPSSGGYNGSMDVGDTLSMPPRAYQAAGSTQQHGLASNQHAKQPHISMFNATSPPSRQPYASGSFDYPQLASGDAGSRNSFSSQPYASPPTLPPAAAATSGLGMRSPSLETAAARAQSMDLSRRPPIPSPYSGPPLSSNAVRPHHTASYRNAPPKSEQYNIRIGLTGLKNMGNSCYINSTLQCLSATIPLARFLLDGSYKKAINRVNPLGTQGALAEAFAQLIRVMWSEQYTFVSPVTFREAIARFAPAFRGCDQHDAQEFLSFLLDGLHEDLNYIKQKPPPVDMSPEREQELETLPQQVASVKEWAIYRERNDSLIVDWFQGQFRNKLTCLTCGKTSTTYNAFLYLSLPIPPVPRGSDRVTLAQCLDAFTRDEILDKADAWHCPRCNKPRRATKKLTISRLPQVLLIHLKRFSFKGPFTDKIKTNVTFPVSNLDLTNYMPPPLPPGAVPKGMPISASQQPPYVYDLYAATHHFGSLSGGHYTATIRTQSESGDPQWMYCDDSRISKSDDREVHSPSSYILWWHRKGR